MWSLNLWYIATGHSPQDSQIQARRGDGDGDGDGRDGAGEGAIDSGVAAGDSAAWRGTWVPHEKAQGTIMKRYYSNYTPWN